MKRLLLLFVMLLIALPCYADMSLEPLLNKAFDASLNSMVVSGTISTDSSVDPNLRIRDGRAFVATVISGDFDIGQQISLTFTTPSSDGFVVHIFPDAFNSGNAIFSLLEGPTVTIGADPKGTSVTPINKNRTNATTSTLNAPTSGVDNAITSGIYMSVHGTTIDMEQIGGNKTGLNGDAWGSKEFILDNDTLYRLNLQALADDTLGTLRLIWYEE